ncbi:hypothetical protein HPB50_001191 [Hyalomma asiaticum]|uniref:Uncharacterized protein n=1 Tax=Hyalomma asiaticum TaxID=266040 RepID=A0ACB7SB69_HYAAI|nr:hypothetical protein HPB50_001191 [Hyalomma asiaticum]
MLHVKSTVCGLEKMLKTGIVAASWESNLQSSTSFASRQLLSPQQSPAANSGEADDILDVAVRRLKEHCLSERPCPSNPDVASVAMVGGFIVGAACENISCTNCAALMQGPKANTPLLGLIAHQDRGRLFYPSQELLKLLLGLRRFVDYVLEHRRCIRRPLETCVKRSVQLLVELPILCCGNADTDHRKQLFELISKKFAKPMLSNYALGATDGNAAVRFFENKPLSRKVLKL